MKTGILFAGQGSQYAGMGKDFYNKYDECREVYDNVNVDFSLKNLCFEGPKEMLDNTAYAQSCILTTSMAISALLKKCGIKADYVAGLSLGEYSALTYAGVLDLNDAVKIVRERGKIMDSAFTGKEVMMAAVLGSDENTIKEVIEEVRTLGVLEIANYNCPGQIVISGEKAACEKAAEKLSERNARRIIPLQVSGAFHTSLLEDASVSLGKELCKYTFGKPEIPVVYNYTGAESDEDIVNILTKQIKSSVRFSQTIEYMISHGVDTFIEVGPGKVLSGFVKKINKDVKVYGIDTVEDYEKMMKGLGL